MLQNLRAYSEVLSGFKFYISGHQGEVYDHLSFIGVHTNSRMAESNISQQRENESHCLWLQLSNLSELSRCVL